MSSIILACGWAVLAHVIALFPSRDHHWRAAYVLIAVGLPIVGYVWWQNGVWIAALVLAAGMSILRWPVYYLYLWVRRVIGKPVQR